MKNGEEKKSKRMAKYITSNSEAGGSQVLEQYLRRIEYGSTIIRRMAQKELGRNTGEIPSESVSVKNQILAYPGIHRITEELLQTNKEF